MSDHIPPEVVTGILSCLPVKSLLCCRAVSKEWRSIIDSKEFTEIHLHQSMTTISRSSIVASSSGKLFSISFSSLDKADEIRNPFGISNALSSCNGVLLLHAPESGMASKMALFNPSIRRHKVLPDAPLPGLDHLRGRAPDYEAIGFGLDSARNDLKVLSITEFADQVTKTWVCQTLIFSLQMNSWKRIKNFPCALPCKKMVAVHVNGCLHLVVQKSPFSEWPKVIVALDLATEDYHLIELPADMNNDKLVGVTLDKIGACLCLHSVYMGSRTVIWVLKDYGIAQSWTMLLSVAPPAIDPYTTLYTIGYSEGGNKLLLNYSQGKFIWYDLESTRTSSVLIEGLPECFLAELCVESLVLLDGLENQDGQENPEIENGIEAITAGIDAIGGSGSGV